MSANWAKLRTLIPVFAATDSSSAAPPWMETKGKMAKTGERKVPKPGTDDRLSSLPDEILSHILSSLETKYAVGTAVLSRRWKDLWTRVSNLDFEDHLFDNPNLEFEERRGCLKFCRFVDRVLSQHENRNSLRRFGLHCSLSCSKFKAVSPNFFSKMELASGSLLDEIDVEFDFAGPIALRSGVLGLPCTLKNLKVLKLKAVEVVVPEQGSIFLPSLNTLQLLTVGIKNCESLSRLISGCPVLETVIVKHPYFSVRNEEYTLIASLPSLKNLTIFDRFALQLCPIVIEAPSLEHLHLRNFGKLQFRGSSSPLPCLVSAKIDICGSGMSNGCLIRFLTHISNAKEMCLSCDVLDLLSSVNGIGLLVFPNLTHLKTKCRRCSGNLHPLLKAAPKLRSLVTEFGALEWESDLACTPECLRSSLEEIKIKNFIVDDGEMKMTAYLLKFGAVLKNVNIHLVDQCLGIKDRRDLVSLLKLSRGSSSCEAHILLPDNKEICIEDESTHLP